MKELKNNVELAIGYMSPNYLQFHWELYDALQHNVYLSPLCNKGICAGEGACFIYKKDGKVKMYPLRARGWVSY